METDVFLELHIPDFEKAVEFYRMLGFRVVWRSKDYLVMRRGKSVLNFYGGTNRVFNHSYFGRFSKKTKMGYAVEIIIVVDDVKAFYKKIKNKVKVVAPLTLKKWGRWDFRVEDPFGFYLRITEKYDWINKLDKKQIELIKKHKAKGN